jgi:hypothetical protein
MGTMINPSQEKGEGSTLIRTMINPSEERGEG